MGTREVKWLQFAIALVVLSIGLGARAGAAAETRIALVIGNSNYENAEELPNPRNDARAIADTFQQLGFEVDVRVDADQPALQDAFRRFGLKAESADVAVVFYAGHGIQVAGENYLLPVDAILERERDLIYEALPLSVVMGEVAQARRLGLVIVDACRDNPLAERLRRALGPIRSRLVGQGLARMDNLPSDTMVAFSTKPGEVAIDGETEHSPYTQALLRHLDEPGVELDLLFRRVRDSVLELTAQRQEPRTYDALGADPFYFKEPQPNHRPEIAALEPFEILDDQGATVLAIPRPTDPDGDAITVQVTGLPRHGVISAAEQPVSIGDILSVEQLMTATFAPSGDFAGDAGSFDFLIKDDRGGLTFARLPIEVQASNKPPVVSSQVLRLPAIPLNIQPPVDPDGDPLTITVAELPGRGTIRHDGEAVEVGQELAPEELAALVLEPDVDGASGRFAFEVTDDRGASVTSSMAINVPALGAPGPVAMAPPEPTTPEEAEREAEGTSSPEAQQAAVAREPEPEPAPPPRETAAGQLEGEPYRTVRTSNIRSGPSAQTARVSTVPEGTPLLVTGQAEGRNWLAVTTEDGLEGYIYGELVEPAPSSGAIEVAEAQDGAPADPEPASAQDEQPAQETQQTAQLSGARALTGGLRDCARCPELVEIPGGTFVMGSDFGHRSERPAHRVEVDPFALGKYEVTVAQYQACVDAGACRPNPDRAGLDPTLPMHDISWSDAQDYVAWLREVTGQPYRLPTEAEWEYAARAGADTRFWWGDEVGSGRANCSNCGGQWDRAQPAPVGSYEPNPLGVHDMNGGAMEWVADCWANDYQGAPADASARNQQNCLKRVLRGGSWQNDQTYATSTSRLSYDFDVRYLTNGFRVARDMN